jgi:Outer membrane protein beta-barrel domain
MKNISLLLCCFISSFTEAQTIETSLNRAKKIRLGINFSTAIGYRKIINADKNIYNDYIIVSRNEKENSSFNYDIGATICYLLNEKINIETGIQYTKKGYSFKNQYLVFENPTGNDLVYANGKYNFNYLDFPFKINIEFGKKRIAFAAGIGFMANALIGNNQKLYVTYADGRNEIRTVKNDFEFRKFNISSIFSAGINCKINNKSNLKIAPTFQYGIVSIIDAPIKEYLWNVGVNFGYYIVL